MSDIIKKREYKDYNEYTAHQIEKTADPERRARLQQKSSFDRKVNYFKKKFQRFLDAKVFIGPRIRPRESFFRSFKVLGRWRQFCSGLLQWPLGRPCRICYHRSCAIFFKYEKRFSFVKRRICQHDV